MKEIDGVLKDWGERTDYGRIKGRKGKNIAGGRYSKPAPTPRPAGREKLALTTRKVPEVMVKISGGGKDMHGIKAHLDYISRNGEVQLEDEQGRIHDGVEDVREVRDDWKGRGIPYENGSKKEAFNIVLSMPPGTDRPSVTNAARVFAAELFSNHQYVFATHEDEKHPHVHLVVKALDNDGVRMNPRKADLQAWREVFAEKLREQGIEANATPRRVRGVVLKAEKQAIRHIDKGFAEGKRKAPARVSQSQKQEAAHEVKTGQKRHNPAKSKILTARKEVHQSYGRVARALAAGDAEDKQLALEIVQLVNTMPPVMTKHDLLVQQVSDSASGRTEQTKKQERGESGLERLNTDRRGRTPDAGMPDKGQER